MQAFHRREALADERVIESEQVVCPTIGYVLQVRRDALVHNKQIVESARLLIAQEVMTHVCDQFGYNPI
ncbi:hypothetical protein [Ktedonobacter racemifer]|uniref:hypothetical protein n=1 Tax=Ktedonobacter racemifer TaxID=363277 RepID=UPI00058C02A0|nr:hypothetical protein [Ktedonobacter racemifer]